MIATIIGALVGAGFAALLLAAIVIRARRACPCGGH